jgi:hypothetical protein
MTLGMVCRAYAHACCGDYHEARGYGFYEGSNLIDYKCYSFAIYEDIGYGTSSTDIGCIWEHTTTLVECSNTNAEIVCRYESVVFKLTEVSSHLSNLHIGRQYYRATNPGAFARMIFYEFPGLLKFCKRVESLTAGLDK